MKQKPIILIVEDEFVKRLVLREQLHRFGVVQEAKCEEKATEKIEKLHREGQPPCVAVVDLRLPAPGGIDPDAGFRVIEHLKTEFPKTPVIVLTVRNDRDGWEKAGKLTNVRYFFTKPWNSEELKKAVKVCRENKARGLKCVGQVEGVSDV